MKKIFLLLGTGILLGTTTMNGQQVSTELLQRFSPSIISKVYHVSSTLTLSNDEQLMLAKDYETQDSLIAVALKNGKSLSDIKKLQKGLLVCHYDSLMEQYKFMQKGQTYLYGKLDALNQIKPLTPDQQERISNLFMQKCQSENCNFGEAFTQLLPRVLKDTAYYAQLYKAEIKQKTLEATNAYPLRNDLSMRILQESRPIIQKYQQALITIDYAYPGASKEKVELIEATHNYYKPRVDSVLVRTGYLKPVNRFTWVIQLRKTLKLTDEQVDQLYGKAAEMQKLEKEFYLTHPYDVFSPNDFPRKCIMKVLSEDQNRTFLQLRYQMKSEEQATDAWKELEGYGLTNGVDSVPTFREMSFYYVDKMVINDMYREKEKEKNAKLEDVEYYKPEIIKKLEEARRMAKEKEKLAKENAKLAEDKAKQAATKAQAKTNFVW